MAVFPLHQHRYVRHDELTFCTLMSEHRLLEFVSMFSNIGNASVEISLGYLINAYHTIQCIFPPGTFAHLLQQQDVFIIWKPLYHVCMYPQSGDLTHYLTVGLSAISAITSASKYYLVSRPSLLQRQTFFLEVVYHDVYILEY